VTGAPEAIEDPGEFFGANAATRVLHPDANRGFVPLRAKRHEAAMRTELQGIADQIQQYLENSMSIEHDRGQVRGKPDVHTGPPGLQLRGDDRVQLRQQLRQIDLFLTD
jgi:hypothetical protein